MNPINHELYFAEKYGMVTPDNLYGGPNFKTQDSRGDLRINQNQNQSSQGELRIKVKPNKNIYGFNSVAPRSRATRINMKDKELKR